MNLFSREATKAWIAAAIAAATTAAGFASDGTFTVPDALGTAVAFLTALGTVYAAPNAGYVHVDTVNTALDSAYAAGKRSGFQSGARAGYALPKTEETARMIHAGEVPDAD